MSPLDMARLHLQDGQPITVKSELGVWHAKARSMAIKPGMVQAYWPECNPIITRRYDPCSEQPDFNAIVSIEPALG
jgi:formylmethanofuran dehydrogenase subunit D